MSWLKNTFGNLIDEVSKFALSFVRPIKYIRMEKNNWELYKALYTLNKSWELRIRRGNDLNNFNGTNNTNWINSFKGPSGGNSINSLLGRKREIDEIDKRLLELELEIEEKKIQIEFISSTVSRKRLHVLRLADVKLKKKKKNWFQRVLAQLGEFFGFDDLSENEEDLWFLQDEYDELLRDQNKLSGRKKHLIRVGSNLKLIIDRRRTLRRYLKRLSRGIDDEEGTLFNEALKRFIYKVFTSNEHKKTIYTIHQFAFSER